MNPKFRKLLGMSVREILFRFRHHFAAASERRRFLSGAFEWSDGEWADKLCSGHHSHLVPHELASWWQNHMQERVEPVMFLSPATLASTTALYRDLFSDQVESVETRAQLSCSGQFSFLGSDVIMQEPIDWNRDPKSGHQWDSVFHADVDFAFCQEGGGDAKYIWDIARQDYLIDCALTFHLTGNKVYSQQIVRWVQSWIEANPYLEGIHWSSALEVAVRALNWLWSYQLCRHENFLSSEEHLAWIKAFYHHAAFLHRHISYYFSPNNHIIAEAVALYILGCFFPEFDEAAEWRAHGWKVIEDYGLQQFYEDGGSTEQALFYHNYCVGFLLLAVMLRDEQGEPVSQQLRDRLERALEFTLWMTRSDGTVPRIGDADNARACCFSHLPLWDFRNLLSIGAVVFQRADMKHVAGKFYEDAVWLLGEKGYRSFQNIAASPPAETTRKFPASGYYLMRSGWGTDESHLSFDSGPIAEGLYTSAIPSSAHGHSDLLSFTLAIAGRPLVVDGGFYTYDEDPQWHRYFREASAHNTVLVDGASHANYHASNAWSSVAIPDPINAHASQLFDYVESSHSGFFNVSPAICHRRAIFHDRQDAWLIMDRLSGGQGMHRIEVFFHLAPSRVTPLGRGQGILIQTDLGLEAELEVHDWPDCHIETIAGGEGPDGGWIGTGYGYRERAPVIRIWGDACLPNSFSFSIRRVEKTGS